MRRDLALVDIDMQAHDALLSMYLIL
jgi:hypothetical protein